MSGEGYRPLTEAEVRVKEGGGTNYNLWTKAQLRAEFLARDLDKPFMSDLALTSRTTKDELVGELVMDDYYCMPCPCPIHRGERAFHAGDWDTPAARYYVAHMRKMGGGPLHFVMEQRLLRYDEWLCLREEAALLHSRARRETPGSPEHRWLYEREQSYRERERRIRERRAERERGDDEPASPGR